MNEEFSNPPFALISAYRSSDLKSSLIDDMGWTCIVEVEDLAITTVISFHLLRDFCETHFPKEAEYFSQVRRQIAGFGPKHPQMFSVFDEEGFDFTPLLEAYINEEIDLGRRKAYALKLARMKPEEIEKQEKQMDALHAAFAEAADSAVRWEEYADRMLDFANREAIRIYPEILESDPEVINKLFVVLERNVRWLADGISELYEGTRK